MRCTAAKSVEVTQEQPSKHNEFNHNFGEQALHQVRLKSEQATEALWSYVISIEKSGTAQWTYH